VAGVAARCRTARDTSPTEKMMEVSTVNRDEIVAWFGESTVADAEALIGKSIEELATDDLQRVIDTGTWQP
jgi:hypothetical protein